jgi:hypothetical protein
VKSDRVERGHFVPQGYLRAFADPERPKQIFVLLKKNPGKTFGNPIAEVASRVGFYDAEDGDTEQIIEHWFADDIESLLPHQIAEFVYLAQQRWRRQLPALLLDQLLIHATLQFLRTAQVREAAETRIADHHRRLGAAEAHLQPMRELPGILSVELAGMEVVMNGPAHATLLMNDANVNAMITDLRAFTWQLHTTEATAPFVTSDAPVLIQRAPSQIRLQEFPLSTVLCYPLTPTALLYGQKVGRIPRSRLLPHLVPVDPARVGVVNRAMFERSHVQLLGNSREALLAAARADD